MHKWSTQTLPFFYLAKLYFNSFIQYILDIFTNIILWTGPYSDLNSSLEVNPPRGPS